MNTPRYDKVQVGDALPALELSPISRTTLALFAGASGDHNPIHIDTDFARKAGMPDVFAHGMLGMAWLGRLLTNWAPQSRLRRFDVRFQGITHLANAISCTGRIVEKREMAPENFDKALADRWYADKDWHTYYTGEITAAYLDK